jgi:hypothetical protein
MNRQQLAKKVRGTVDHLVFEKDYVSPVDLFMSMDKLSKQNYEAWRKKQIPHLEKVLLGNLNQLSFILKQLRSHAKSRGLKPSWTGYNSWGKGRKVRLQFSKSGNPKLEEAYATHFVDTKEKRQRSKQTS